MKYAWLTFHKQLPAGQRLAAALAFFSVALIIISGCGTWMFPGKEVAVDSGVVAEVKAKGNVVAQTKIPIPWDGTTTTTEVLILNVGVVGSQDAVEKASGLLEGLGWEIVDRRSPLEMVSKKWDKVVLGVVGVDSYSFDELDAPQVGQAIEEAKKDVKSESLVVIELHPTDG